MNTSSALKDFQAITLVPLAIVPRPTLSPVRAQFYLGDFSQLSEAVRNAICLELISAIAAYECDMSYPALANDAKQAMNALPTLERLAAENTAANIEAVWRRSSYSEAVIDAALLGLSVKPMAQQTLVFRVGAR
jgi:hypothetical protein